MLTSFLVDPQIVDAVKEGELVIQDPDGREMLQKDGTRARDAQLDAHGYILRARLICSWRNGNNEDWISLKEKNTYTLRPQEQVFIETYEHFYLCPSICGTIHALARLTLLGLSHISTTVHPGWGSPEKPEALRIAITNMGQVPWVISDKEPIARMVFHESAIK